MRTLYLLLISALVSFSAFVSEKGTPRADKKVRQDTIHIIGHAHMDMNWLWTTSETMKIR